MADGSVTPAQDTARLLLISSDETLQSELCTALTSLFAAPPIVALLGGGRPALELLRGSAFDIIAADLAAIVDMAATLEDQVARLARAAGDALVVAVSPDASVSTSMRAMQAGAHDCVPCGLAPASLIERLGHLVRRHTPTRNLVAAASPNTTPAPRPEIPPMHDLVLPMWRQEQRIIEQAIQSFAGNIALAAAALELSPSTIYRKRQAWAEMDAQRAG